MTTLQNGNTEAEPHVDANMEIQRENREFAEDQAAADCNAQISLQPFSISGQ